MPLALNLSAKGRQALPKGGRGISLGRVKLLPCCKRTCFVFPLQSVQDTKTHYLFFACVNVSLPFASISFPVYIQILEPMTTMPSL